MRLSLALLLILAASGSERILLDLVADPVGLPRGWRLRPVARVPPPRFELTEGRAGRALRISGEGAAAFAIRELDEPIQPGPGELCWTWRVLRSPPSADLARADRDDSPLRVYVVFGRGALFRRPRALFYTWTPADEERFDGRSHVSERIHVIGIPGTTDGGWRVQRVEPFADYRRRFSREPPPVTAIGLMQDTDATGESALAEIRELLWAPG